MNQKVIAVVVLLYSMLFSVCAADVQKLPDPINTAIIAPAEPVAPPVVKNTVNLPAPINNITVPPAVTNTTITVPQNAPEPIDWKLFLAQLGALWSALGAVYGFIKLHHAELAKAAALEDFVAYCYQHANDAPSWLEDAFTMVGNEFKKRFGKTMTDSQWIVFKHALSALHLQIGLPKTEEDPAVAAAEKALDDARAAAKKRAGIPLPSVITALVLFALMFTGCNDVSKATRDAHDASVKRRDAHISTVEAAQKAEDEALFSAASNNYQFRLDTRNAACNAVAAQRPDLLPQVLAAKDTANAEYNALISAQTVGQARINAVIAQSQATNMQQAKAIDAAIFKSAQAPVFDGTAAIQTVVTGLQQLQPAPKAVTITAAPIVPVTTVKTTAEIVK